jgi:hypothetical protein
MPDSNALPIHFQNEVLMSNANIVSRAVMNTLESSQCLGTMITQT